MVKPFEEELNMRIHQLDRERDYSILKIFQIHSSSKTTSDEKANET
jgi:hypothetical protein